MRSVIWDGLDNQNRKVTSGVYIYKIESEEFNQSRKMILIE